MGDDARESKRQARRRESRSMEETKSPALRFDCPERNPDFRPERRHDNKESYTDIKRRTSHEKDSKSLLLKKKKKKMVKKLTFFWVFIYTVVSVSVEAIVFSIILVVRYTFDLSLWILVAKVTQSSFRMIVSSLSYLQFFLRGFCKDGSACKFLHARDKEAPMRQALSSNEKKNSPKEMDGEEPMRQSSRRQETESDYGQEEKETKDWELKQIEKTEWQRREAQRNVKEHRQREGQRREAQENVQEHRQKETSGCQRYSEKKRREAQENTQERRFTREAQEMGRRKSKAFSEEQRVKERNMDLRSSKSDVRTDRRHKRDPRICAEKRFFRRGFCKDGSDCKFIHAKNNEALRLPNTMRQPLSHPKDRDGAETMRQRDNTEWQRGEAQENVHEHRQRDITECQRYYEMGRRDAQEIVVKQHRQRDITESLRYFEMGRRDAQVIVQQHRQREASGRQRYLEEEKSEEAQENDQEQRLMVTPLDGRFDERRHETESSSMAEKREELFTSLQSVFKDVIDDIAAGYERVGTEHGEGNVGRQRVEAEEIVQEQSNRDGDVL
ncbi:BnaA09g26750D [Brassica napus]|uniref:BnaA09g26750D protein n=1 Tax=Brassica napus TaxID=3708 RepID=A0A078IEA1_BRANA|nr:BnaA09g26750D [Brassica napus]